MCVSSRDLCFPGFALERHFPVESYSPWRRPVNHSHHSSTGAVPSSLLYLLENPAVEAPLPDSSSLSSFGPFPETRNKASGTPLF